jgi:hypothetical protein
MLYCVGVDARLESVHYFSALAYHIDGRAPGTTTRHETYLACARDTGVRIDLGHFKRKSFRCPSCLRRTALHEEKETDVAIASRLFELLLDDRCDTVVLVTGDSDLAPALRTAARLFPAKRLMACFPFDRVSEELKRAAQGHFKTNASHYLQHQFTNPYLTKAGSQIWRPVEW